LNAVISGEFFSFSLRISVIDLSEGDDVGVDINEFLGHKEAKREIKNTKSND
jgi:hypothetical protein